MDVKQVLALLCEGFNNMDIKSYIDVSTGVEMMMLPIETVTVDGGEHHLAEAVFFEQTGESYFQELKTQILKFCIYFEKMDDLSHINELRAFFAEVNMHLSVGSFGVDYTGTIYYASSIPVPDETTLELLWRQAVTVYALMRINTNFYLGHTYAVMKGEMDAQTALNDLLHSLSNANAAIEKALAEERR